MEDTRKAFSVQVRNTKDFTIKASWKSDASDRCELDLHASRLAGEAFFWRQVARP
jgi:hypothetical protein